MKSSTKILVVDIHFAPELIGVGKYSGEFVEYLIDHGYQVTVVTAYPSYPKWKIFPEYQGKNYWYRRETWRGAQVIRCPLWVPTRPSALTRLVYISIFGITSTLAAIYESLRWRPDILLGVVPTLTSLAWFPLFGWMCPRGKTWIHIQDFEIDAALNLGMLPVWLQKISLSWETWLYRQASIVSTISNKMLDRLHQRKIPAGKLLLFPNWVDIDFIHPLPESAILRHEFFVSVEKIIILYSGNFGKKQGLDILLDVACELQHEPAIQFVLCGEGADANMVMTRARSMPNVTILPLQPLEKLNQLLNMADIHALPQKEGVSDLVLPSKLSGMLASGRPVVATALPETELGKIINDVGVLVNPGDVVGFASVLRELAGNPAKRIVLGQKGRDWVVGTWSKQVVLDYIVRTISGIDKGLDGK